MNAHVAPAPLAFIPVDPVEDVLARLANFRRRAFGVKTDFEADLMEWFGFEPRQARVVAILYEARGPVSRSVIMGQADVTRLTLKQDLGHIRQALGEGALPLPTDGFYQLTQLGRAACEEAVENVGIGYLRRRLAA